MNAPIEETVCPSCGAPACPAATVCGEQDCGEKLTPSNATARPGEQLDAGNPAGQKETV